MERDTYLLIKDEGKDKKRSKKLDWVIYGLAVISFVLMVVVIIHNNKTSIEILEPEKTVIVQKQEKPLMQIQDDLMAKEKAEKSKVQETQIAAQKQAEQQKLIEQQKIAALEAAKKESMVKPTEIKEVKKETKQAVSVKTEKPAIQYPKKEAVTAHKKVEKQTSSHAYSGKYNWKLLSKYPVKPDANLTVSNTHVVQTGDAFWKLAEKYHVKTINIIAVNPHLKNPNYILPGQIVNIPNK